jgi:hypothetical protein
VADADASMPGARLRRQDLMRQGTRRRRGARTAVAQGAWASGLRGVHREATRKGQTTMMTQTEMEARLLAVEAALTVLERRLATLPPPPHWLDELIGSFKDAPAFDEVSVLGRAFREAEPYPDDAGPAA